MVNTANSVPEALQASLNEMAEQSADCKEQVVELLNGEQPAKSRLVDLAYTQCTWWEGCYYCRDEAKQWHRVKCFI
ncbi:MAG: hypothetical protein KME07_03595 [Pegethrix bostrychoides GSE-TBD4-15B]|jgi:hypothetical protein|uniref:Uncharacterized protein n=1 Tax=Pegethrix bostrychoides GSE-TBD4-15B TaxID=2839662 RepID=A0A951P8X1_9CYAN|nr:hypothetical protein [Pegethrix bostrychoides GSE-TBD4-15B]